MNLVLNASDSLPNGGRVLLRTGATGRPFAEEPGSLPPGDVEPHVLLEVIDSGVGIAARLLGRVFEPFVTTKRQQGRAGLGLATVRRVASRHGGRVDVSSIPGSGSTFRLCLPADASHRVAAEAAGRTG